MRRLQEVELLLDLLEQTLLLLHHLTVSTLAILMLLELMRGKACATSTFVRRR